MKPSLAIVGILGLAPALAAQSTLLVSADAGGNQAAGASYLPTVSADGRFVVFSTGATNLIPGGDANGTSIDVFVRDLDSGSLELVSRSTSGVQANGSSGGAAISADARFVAFSSLATNLSAGPDANGAFSDVFVRDRVLNTTERVSTTWNGVQSMQHCGYPSISADGRFVAFVSDDITLVQNPNPNHVLDVFVRDRLAATTVLASVGATGAYADADCGSYALSGDGRFVAFISESTTLTPGPDANGFMPDVFVRDLVAGTTEVVSVDPGGAQVQGASVFSPGISHDGRFVVFSCSSDAVVAGDANGWPDVFVRDRATGTTRLASVGPGGVQADRSCVLSSISGDGRIVAFVSNATTLVPTAMPFTAHVYVRDMLTGSIELASQSTGGAAGNGPAESTFLSSDGSTCVFTSFATNLVAPDTNGVKDAFARRRGDAARSYCFGDGSGAPCPCGNVGAPRRGCENSVATGGAALSAIGGASLSADTLRLEGSGFPATATVLIFQGALAAQGGGFAFGDGLRCTSGQTVRLAVRSASGGIAAYGSGVGSDVPVSVRGAVTDAFGSRSYQVWYRDVAPFCTASTFNLTNGARCTWTP